MRGDFDEDELDDNEGELIDCTAEVRAMTAILEARTKLLRTACAALRSYQFGNGATALAREVADAIDAHLKPPRHRRAAEP